LVLVVGDRRLADDDGERVADAARAVVLEQERVPRVPALPQRIRPAYRKRAHREHEERDYPPPHREPPRSTSTVPGPVTRAEIVFFESTFWTRIVWPSLPACWASPTALTFSPPVFTCIATRSRGRTMISLDADALPAAGVPVGAVGTGGTG